MMLEYPGMLRGLMVIAYCDSRGFFPQQLESL